MSEDIHVRLAHRLDALPNGFPPTESGVELRILRKIFSPEDAAWALQLKAFPETAEALARRVRHPIDEVRTRLEAMAERGQIASFLLEGVRHYVFVPFVVGIYEFQLEHMDRELAEMFEEYAPTLFSVVGAVKPALARVVPVNQRIGAQAQVLPYDDLHAALDRAQAFRVGQCICRKEQALLGKPCTHPLETCLTFAAEEAAFKDAPTWGREITRAEAHAVLDNAEREGLVHCTYNFQKEPFFVCNCCRCCCGFLRGVTEFHTPYTLVRSNLVSAIDESLCSLCGVCAEERCPMDAIAASNGGYAVDGERCIGCGVCAAVCPSGALALQPRPTPEQLVPPQTLVHWNVARDRERRGWLHSVGLGVWVAWQATMMKLRRKQVGN